jgi:hypothetical protein
MKSTLFFMMPVVLGFIVSWTSTSIAADEVRRVLDSLSANCVVSINSRPVESRNEILDALRTSRGLRAHHSHPTQTIDVEISDPPRHLSLEVARDSENKEYWVFVASPSELTSRASLKTDIGHIMTSVFDAY